ncbi:helix-turn-helix transcriptional regulator [Clostridium sp.]|uniref:helix-turn-helix transcriptional regulator n=1 Tax=Clostridium sp. TaxID=1506 RepID=UPI003F3466F4
MKNKIQELRKSKKITQGELAQMCGVSRQTIISLENGKYNPSILLAHKIAKIFNCIIEDIFIFEI